MGCLKKVDREGSVSWNLPNVFNILPPLSFVGEI